MGDITRLSGLLLEFGISVISANIDSEEIPIQSFNSTWMIYGKRNIVLELKCVESGIHQLVNCLDTLDKIKREEEMRAADPFLQTAYEEYKILLELKK